MPPKLKIMVASTVYQFEDQIQQICAVLSGFGYEVWNSVIGTIPVHPGRSNEQICVAAAASCDAFLGIVRPFYGSGIVGARSITHNECLEAIKSAKPRWFLVHRDVTFARQLLKQYRFDKNGVRVLFAFQKCPVMDDLRVIDLYDDVILSGTDPASRKGHWAQEFHRIEDALRYVDFQFRDTDRVRAICDEMKAP